MVEKLVVFSRSVKPKEKSFMHTSLWSMLPNLQ
jgi:hypothetical protein